MYVLTEISVADFDPAQRPESGRFRVVSSCADPKDPASAEVRTRIQEMEANDQRQALLGLKHFLKLTQMGKPLNHLQDRSKVHEAFEPFYCHLTQKAETVWRYRHGDIRILFYYAADKLMLLPHVLVKRTDRLSKKDKAVAVRAVEAFLTALQSPTGLMWIS